VSIAAGQASRNKLVTVKGLSGDDVRARVDPGRPLAVRDRS
jgi:hypothetical protein